MGNETCGRLVDEVLGSKDFYPKFVSNPGSATPHYGRQGGLLANTVRVTDGCIKLSDDYRLSEKERAILIAAAMLHRVGGVDAFGFMDCMPKESTRGKLLGVNMLTVSRISIALRRVNALAKEEKWSLDRDAVLRVLHAIVSYDGNSVLPKTKEAMVLSAVAKSDADMVEAMDFIENDLNTSEEFTAYDPKMRREYYRGTE